MESGRKKVKIKFETEEIECELKLAVKAIPNILSMIDIDNPEITLPQSKNFDPKSLSDYFSYVYMTYHPEGVNNDANFNFKRLTQFANFFSNEDALENMIKFNMIPNINKDNCVFLINDAFKYSNDNQLTNGIRRKWEFFLNKLISFILENISTLISNDFIRKIDSHLLKRILSKYILLRKKEVTDDQLISTIRFSGGELRDRDLFEMILDEHLDNSNLNNALSEFTQYITIDKKFTNPDSEFETDIFGQKLMISTRYDRSKDELIVYIKNPYINKNSFQLLSLTTFTSKLSERGVIKTLFKDIKYPIANIKNYSKKLINDNNYNYTFQVSINAVETFLINFLYENFEKFTQKEGISRVPSEVMLVLLQNKRSSEESSLTGIMNWCKYKNIINYS